MFGPIHEVFLGNLAHFKSQKAIVLSFSKLFTIMHVLIVVFSLHLSDPATCDAIDWMVEQKNVSKTKRPPPQKKRRLLQYCRRL